MSSASDRWSPLVIGNGHGRIAGRDGICIAGVDKISASKEDIYIKLGEAPADSMVLIATPKGEYYNELEMQLPPGIARRALYVEGGTQAIGKAMALRDAAARSPMTASLRSSGQGVTRAGSCGGCGKK